MSTQIEQCSKALLASGVEKGDRVATLCTPSSDFYVIFLATVNIGAIWIGLNPKYSLDEFKHVIEDASPKLLFSMIAIEHRDYTDELNYLYRNYDCIEHLVFLGTGAVSTLSFADFLGHHTQVSQLHYVEAIEAVESMDPALIVYTSGTTGRPKGAKLSHYGLCFGSEVQADHFDIDDPTIICNMPINHVACIADICCTTLVKGGTIHFHDSFNPQAMLKTIEKEKIKMWAGVPTMFLLQLNVENFSEFDLSHLQLILWGGAAMPESALMQLKKLNLPMMTLYGMTETSAHTIYSSKNASLSSLRHCIGFPDPRMPCRIADEHSKQCGFGIKGELQFKGNYLMLGYYNNPSATAAAFTKDGWFKTGDLAVQRENGEISLVGRMSEMFKSGGYNVYPKEVEILLETHPLVETAVVVSIPDIIFQEVGVAFIVSPKNKVLDTQALFAFCKQHLANYKVPKKLIQIVKLPLLPIGKVDKNALKDIAVDFCEV